MRLCDADLFSVDAPSETVPAGREETLQHPPSFQTPLHSTRFATKRTHHFSVKRPRKNVAKRSIPTWTSVEEDKETPLDVDAAEKRGIGDGPLRAPRVALALFILVCSTGVYRGFNVFLINQKAVKSRPDGMNATHPFRDSQDGEHRGALLQEEGTISQPNFPHNTEDNPKHLFDEVSNLANIFHEPYDPQHNKLFVWHIPRTGTTTIKRIASYCMGLTIASEAGKSEDTATTGSSQEVRIVEGMDGTHFAQVDLSNPGGIALAKTLNVGQSEEIDLVSSPYLWDLASIFDVQHKGYMIAMFREPIERAVSLYYSLRRNQHYAKQVGSLSSVEQYAKSSLVENNWMTRFLSNALSGELSPQHEAIAREVLRSKCIIGLISDKTETMRRLELLFRVKANKSRKSEECQEKLLYWSWPGKNRHTPVVDGEAWDILHKQNTFDLRLYEYAQDLFEAQRKLFLESQN